jgi:hypothetical protein
LVAGCRTTTTQARPARRPDVALPAADHLGVRRGRGQTCREPLRPCAWLAGSRRCLCFGGRPKPLTLTLAFTSATRLHSHTRRPTSASSTRSGSGRIRTCRRLWRVTTSTTCQAAIRSRSSRCRARQARGGEEPSERPPLSLRWRTPGERPRQADRQGHRASGWQSYASKQCPSWSCWLWRLKRGTLALAPILLSLAPPATDSGYDCSHARKRTPQRGR